MAFKLIAGHVALDFVNTLDERFSGNGSIELIKDYSGLVEFLIQSKLLDRPMRGTAGLVRTARDLRESLAAVLYPWADGKPLPLREVESLQSYFHAAARHRRLVKRKLGFTWTWDGLEKNPHLPIWILSQAAADLLTSPSAELIRTCASDTCRWLFLDTSKNHTRRWCDMKLCGNRTKARRFQARNRG